MNTPNRGTHRVPNHTEGAAQASAQARPGRGLPPRAVRRRPNKGLMMGMRIAMLVLILLILVFGTLLAVLPMFRVMNVEIEGNKLHTYDEILAASGIQKGKDESMALDGDRITQNIFDNCDYVYACDVIVMPFSVKIIVVEHENVKSASFGDQEFSFDTSFRVLEIIENGESFASPFLHVKLPTVLAIQKGSKIAFADADAELSYIATLCTALERSGLMENVTYIDLSERSALSCVLDGRFQIELGSSSGGLREMTEKLTNVKEVLEEKQKSGINMEEEIAILDASNLQKTTYRSVDSLPQD